MHAPKTKKKFFSEMKKPDPKLSKPFYFNKIYVLVELCFSILCNAFLLKSVISSHNSPVIKVPWSTVVSRLLKSFEFGNGSRMSDENLVILEFKYLQNKKW